MRKFGIGWVAAGAVLFALGTGARADQVLYRGESPGTTGLQLAGWGSGIAVDSPTQAYAGSRSLRVSVDGFYSGGRIIYTRPIDLTSDVSNPNGFLEFVIRFQPGQIKSAANLP